MPLPNQLMTYEEILKQAPKEYCQQVAKRIGLPDRLPVSSLRRKIPQQLLNLPFLKDLVSHLTPYERSVLTILTFACGGGGVPFDLFNRKLNQLSQKWPYISREIRRDLNELGLVFAMTVDGFRYCYVIPEDLRILLLQIFADDINVMLISPEQTPKAIRNDGLALIHDIFTFLSFADRYGIKTTQQRTIYKRTEQQILKEFEATEDTPKIYDQINPTAGNTDRLEFIRQFCWDNGLIDWEASGMRCSLEGREWIHKSDAEKIADIYSHWLEKSVSTRTPLIIALSISRILPPNRWILLSSIQEQVDEFGLEVIWKQTLYSYLERTFINHLTYMGCLAFANLGDDVAIQVTDLGRRIFSKKPIESYETELTFILQPTYEILASSYLDPEILWTLNQISELSRASQVSTYKLTAESIYGGLRSGMSIDEIFGFLRTHSKTGIPQNIEIAIKEWAERYGQIYFMEVMLLRCKSERLAQELKTSKQIGKYILGEISSKDLIVPRQKVNELLLLLEKKNYMPLPEVVTVEDK